MAARCGCGVRVGQGEGGELRDTVDGVGDGAAEQAATPDLVAVELLEQRR
jgi:hypothetical protein